MEEDTYCSHTLCYKLHEDRETGIITNSFHTITELKGKEGRGVGVKGKERKPTYSEHSPSSIATHRLLWKMQTEKLQQK